MENSTEEEMQRNYEPADLDYQIQIAIQTLDRNIGFINSCDNKTSIVLTAFGVVMTIILTYNGFSKIGCILMECTKNMQFCDVLYLLFALGSAVMFCYGIWCLVEVLIAKVSESVSGLENHQSNFFFTGIRKNAALDQYVEKFSGLTKQDILKDLLSEIYINADIATTKFTRYNKGLKAAMLGFVMFVCIFVIGIYIY